MMAKRYSASRAAKVRKRPTCLLLPFYLVYLLLYKYKNTMYFQFCVVLKISILKNMPTKLYPQTKLKLKCISLLSGFLDIKFSLVPICVAC